MTRSRKVHLHCFSKVCIIQVNCVPRGKGPAVIDPADGLPSFVVGRRGSPMVIGVKCTDQLIANHIPVMFSKGEETICVVVFFLVRIVVFDRCV